MNANIYICWGCGGHERRPRMGQPTIQLENAPVLNIELILQYCMTRNIVQFLSDGQPCHLSLYWWSRVFSRCTSSFTMENEDCCLLLKICKTTPRCLKWLPGVQNDSPVSDYCTPGSLNSPMVNIPGSDFLVYLEQSSEQVYKKLSGDK